jgi:hypothetical protein
MPRVKKFSRNLSAARRVMISRKIRCGWSIDVWTIRKRVAYCPMESNTVLLYQANDAEESFAIRLENDPPESWRFQKGFGKHFQQVWSVELQGDLRPNFSLVDWEAVLDRILEAYHLSDPLLTNFTWPHLQAV